MLRHVLVSVLIAMGILADSELAMAKVDPAALVTRGNLNYEEGKFKDSADAYRSAIEAGADNGHIFYNLGNAHYRLGEFGHAILNYRRALLDLPRDPDIRANLNLARTHSIDKLEDDGGALGIFNPARLLFLNRSFNQFELTVMTLGCYLCFWVLVAFEGWKPSKFLRWAVMGALVVTLISGSLTFFVSPGRDGEPRFALSAESRSLKPAVVVTSESKVYSGNSETFQVIYLLHEGAEVEVREIRDNWFELVLPGKRSGWVKSDAIDLI